MYFVDFYPSVDAGYTTRVVVKDMESAVSAADSMIRDGRASAAWAVYVPKV